MYSAKPPSRWYPVNDGASQRFSLPAAQKPHVPHARASHATPIRSPTENRRDPSPGASTVPTTWWPGMTGRRRGGRSPSITWRSVRQIPQTRTRTLISPGPGEGSGTSCRESGEVPIGATRPRTAAFTEGGTSRGRGSRNPPPRSPSGSGRRSAWRCGRSSPVSRLRRAGWRARS